MIHATKGDTQKAVTLSADLSDVASVAYHLKPRPGTGTLSGAATIADRPGRVVTFPVPATSGRYDAEFALTYNNGDHETVPNAFADVLLVREPV